MGAGPRATRVAFYSQMKTLMKHTTIDGRECGSTEYSIGALSRDKAKALDGSGVYNWVPRCCWF